MIYVLVQIEFSRFLHPGVVPGTYGTSPGTQHVVESCDEFNEAIEHLKPA